MATPKASGSNNGAASSPSAAAEEALHENQTALHLPGVGDVSLPPLDHLAWYAGVATLTALELIEWPVALVLAAGKMLADNRSHRTLRSLGDALEEAG
jgi:hypothetical protein